MEMARLCCPFVNKGVEIHRNDETWRWREECNWMLKNLNHWITTKSRALTPVRLMYYCKTPLENAFRRHRKTGSNRDRSDKGGATWVQGVRVVTRADRRRTALRWRAEWVRKYDEHAHTRQNSKYENVSQVARCLYLQCLILRTYFVNLCW